MFCLLHIRCHFITFNPKLELKCKSVLNEV
jgi:hypothetical protein